MNRKYVCLLIIMAILISISIYIPDSKAQEIINEYIRRPYGVLARENAEYQPVHDPADEPFDWYRNSRYTIGVLGGPEETLVTAEGYLRTYFGTLKFYTGKDICLYINGYPVQCKPRELSRGIGFTSPSDIISFGRNKEGTVRISFTLTYAPGKHTVTIGLGDTLLPSATIRIME